MTLVGLQLGRAVSRVVHIRPDLLTGVGLLGAAGSNGSNEGFTRNQCL